MDKTRAWYPDVKLRLWTVEKENGGMNPHDRFEMQPGVLLST